MSGAKLFPKLPRIPALLCVALLLILPSQRNTLSAAESHPATILKPGDLTNLMPATVFFRGQTASVQARNSGGVRFPDGMLVLCALVDTAGYSSSVQQKYQAYFITEVALDLGGRTLQPGAYGVGFIAGDRFVVMDVGGHDLLSAGSTHDLALKRPTPLQVLPDAMAGRFRLYINRNYIVFSRAAGDPAQ